MKLDLRVPSLPLLLALATMTVPREARAQDPCPSASAVDAEAGWTAYQGSDIRRARDRFEAALARCDNDQYARTGLGYVELRGNDTEAAESLFLTVVRAEPGNVDALVGLGLVSWRSADLDRVREYFETALAYAPDHPTALDYLARLEGGAGRPEDEAGTAWMAGDMGRARTLYERRLQADPDDGIALLRLGLMHGWDGEYGEGLDLLDRVIASDASNLEARLARSRLLAWSGDFGRAMSGVEQILSLEPDNVDALEALALFQSWAGQAEEALESYEQLLAIAPGQTPARLAQARALAWAQRYDQSLAAYEALVAERPDDLEARRGLARVRGFSGNFDGAIAEFERVLERDPADVGALTGRARTLGWAGRLVEAERAARAAVDARPESGAAWGVLGEIHRWQSRAGAADEALSRASDLAPNDPTIRDQVRSLDRALAPHGVPTVRLEDDSDGNRMVTTRAEARWHPMPRLALRADVYGRDVDQDLATSRIERTAYGAFVTGTYEVDPGWNVIGGLGGSTTDGAGDPSFFAYRLAVRSPQRHPLDVTLEWSSAGLDDTAALIERGVRSNQLLLTGRWRPSLDWRVDGQVGVGSYEGTESNGRRSALVSVLRSVGATLSVGAGLRGFSFEKNLFDGYFDPDFYGIAEVMGVWLYRPMPWSFVVEVAPGLEQVTSDGDASAAIRANGRAAYRVREATEVSLAASYSTASITSFGSGEDGYRYVSVLLGVSWVF
ncbi:MAG: tetratricopeptide repeat protein [Gemmatimonadota bacterium]|nr:tetratricopeptide repeat protein [Gemmatimonadota bacterium]